MPELNLERQEELASMERGILESEHGLCFPWEQVQVARDGAASGKLLSGFWLYALGKNFYVVSLYSIVFFQMGQWGLAGLKHVTPYLGNIIPWFVISSFMMWTLVIFFLKKL